MDEDGDKRARAKRSGEVDWISNLPDCLLCQVLSNLPTKDVVKTSVLSTRWINLWKYVPVLDLGNGDFPEYNTFVGFVDGFLDFNSESSLQKFKLKDDCDGHNEPEVNLISRWINTVVTRKVKHIDVLDDSSGSWDFQMPTTLYTCESLVSLKLCGLTLPSPKFVSLPSLKVMDLIIAKFADELALETLISLCPVLERLTIERCFCDDIEVVRVRSQSHDKSLVVAIDAPRLHYLIKLYDYDTPNVIVNNLGSLVKVDIDIVLKHGSIIRSFAPNNLKRNMIRNFLDGISTVEDMVISSSRTLEVIYDYLKCQPLPLFPNLTSMRATDYKWQMLLPAFLESFPNLKSLVLESTRYPEKEGISILSGRPCFMSSLEHVEIENPLTGLVTYFLDNSTLCLDDSRKEGESVILKRPLTTPTLSASRN